MFNWTPEERPYDRRPRHRRDLTEGFGVATEVADMTHETHETHGPTGPVTDQRELISSVIAEISSLQTTVAATVDERAAARRDHERGVEQVALVTADINSIIGRIADDAVPTTAVAGSGDETTTDLARLASNVKVLVGQFQ
jgi:methyl-accepting chemotaxis protein